ncbi:hypothetical protein [Tuwongella immobilis]|uniref:Uncharacterized protein n=1 Tax=Tuwongella immobilis TaxID=692036 RepID=A0A6C2YUV6_9BACT|nr:hypothetical protein [Tuwongella immobilis]VIP05400.1 unnamed protein product [Tuwongella immobilis]VTS08156.1 unnamed protein product [Tuwongella immobilis]
MKGFMQRCLAVGGLGLTLAMGVGCTGVTGDRVSNFVDPCWPERYNAQARSSVVSYFGAQAQNGHILDQTIWNYHFEPGTDKLHPGGMEKLDNLIRRRPAPDGRLFLATARDLSYSEGEPALYAQQRQELDGKRIQAIQRYLNSQTAGRPMQFEVLVHDPVEVNQRGLSASLVDLQNTASVQGSLLGAGGAAGGGAAGGGAAGGAGGIGAAGAGAAGAAAGGANNAGAAAGGGTR